MEAKGENKMPRKATCKGCKKDITDMLSWYVRHGTDYCGFSCYEKLKAAGKAPPDPPEAT